MLLRAIAIELQAVNLNKAIKGSFMSQSGIVK